MDRAPAVENDLILSMLPARPNGRRIALGVVLVWLALFLAAAPFAKLPLAQVPAFLPFYQGALIIIDAITALLLFSQARVAGSRALLVLACGYVFTALITLAHLLTFPAVFSATGLLGAGLQSTAWMYMFWHGGFPLVVLVYAFLKGDARKPEVVNRNSILAGLLAAALAAAGFTLLATAGHALLPEVILQNRFTPAMIYVVATVWALAAIAAAVLWLRRPHFVLDLWLMVVMSAWVFEMGLAGVFNGGRYDLGFYTGRVFGLLAASLLLMMLLYEQVMMYTRLLEARARERRSVNALGVANADIAARKQAEEQLRESEGRYRSLFESMDEGYCIIEVIFDENGKSVDHRYLEINPAFESLTGLHGMVGKRIREIVPDLEKFWFEYFGKVVQTGEPVRFENEAKPLNRWFDVYAQRIGGPESRKISILFNNITERKRREHLQAFLLTLSDALGPLVDPYEIQVLAADLLGEHLQVNQAHYGEVRGEYTHVSHSYANGLAPMVGTFHPDAFGKRLIEGLRAGRLQICVNTASDPLFDEQERKVMAAANIGAYIGVPLVKEGVWVAVLSVHNIQPRDWTPAEVEAVQEVAERTWAAVERTRADRALSKSEEKYGTLFDSIDEGVAVVEVLFDDEDRAHDYVILETNQAHEKMSGMPRTFVGKRVREVIPHIEESVIERVGRVALTGEPIRFEEYVSALGRWFDIYLSRVGGEGSRTVVSLANNITERKRREQHAAFLDKLSQALTLLESPEEIVRATGEALGAYLDVSFVHVVDVELDAGDEPAEARITVLATWEREGFLVASGTYRAGDYLSEEFLRAARAGEPIVTPDADTDPRVDTEAYRAIGVRAVVAVPILKDDAWPGLIAVGTPGVRDWRPDEVTLIVEVAHRIFPLFERVRAVEALRESEVRLRESAVRTRSLQRRLMESEENERRAIHREMHDRIGQDLASAKLNIDLARSSAATGTRLEIARGLVQNAIDNSRNIMAELRPPGLDEHGLVVALELYAEEVAKRLSISVTVHGIELEQRLPRLVETTFFRITQEAISNLAKHANAREVNISLREEAQEVRLRIADDGSGFDVTAPPEAGRYGFQIMRERAEAVDARLEIESTPGRGTRIIAILKRTA